MERSEKLGIAVALVVSAMAGQADDGSGLTVKSEDVHWPRWQGRLSAGTLIPSPITPGPVGATGGGQPGGLSLMGDYYLTSALLGSSRAGGLRATSGLMIGSRSPYGGLPTAVPGGGFGPDRRPVGQTLPLLPGDATTDTAPYVGIGYTGLSPRGGWSFRADLGLLSLSPGTVKLGRVFGGGQGLDDAVRDMRLSPVLQLGVSYAF